MGICIYDIPGVLNYYPFFPLVFHSFKGWKMKLKKKVKKKKKKEEEEEEEKEETAYYLLRNLFFF